MAALFDDLRRLIGPRAVNAQELCELLAEHYGGERIYVPKVCDRPRIEPHDTPQTLMAKGVRRSTAYNWVTRWRP